MHHFDKRSHRVIWCIDLTFRMWQFSYLSSFAADFEELIGKRHMLDSHWTRSSYEDLSYYLYIARNDNETSILHLGRKKSPMRWLMKVYITLFRTGTSSFVIVTTLIIRTTRMTDNLARTKFEIIPVLVVVSTLAIWYTQYFKKIYPCMGEN